MRRCVSVWIVSAIAFCLTLSSPEFVFGATRTWTGATSSNFSTDSNWSGGVKPGASDTAVIPAVATAPIITTTEIVDVLNVQNGGILTVSTGGSLEIDNANSAIDAGGLLVVSGGSVSWTRTQNGTSHTIAGTVQINTGSYSVTDAGNNIIVNSGGIIDLNGGTLAVGQTLDVQAGGYVDMDGGTLTAGSNITLRGGTTGGRLDLDTGTITINGSLQLEGNATDGGDLRMNSGTFNCGDSASDVFSIGTGTPTSNATAVMNGGTFNSGDVNTAAGSSLTMSGNSTLLTLIDDWTLNGTFTPGTSTVRYLNGSSSTISQATTFYNLHVQSTGTTLTLAASIVVSNQLRLSAGTFALAALSCDVNGSVLVDGSMTVTSSAGSVFTVAGDWTNNAACNMSGTAGILRFDGAGAQSLGGTTDITVPTLDHAGAGTLTLGIDVIVNQDLLVSSGTLNTGNRALDISRHLNIASGATLTVGSSSILIDENWTNNGTFNGGTSTVTWDNDNNNGILSGSSLTTFYNVILNDVSDTLTLARSVAISNDLLTQNGSFITAGFDVNVGRDWTHSVGTCTNTTSVITVGRDLSVAAAYTLTSGSLTVSRDLALSASTLTASSSTINVTRNVLISGGTFSMGSATISVGGNWTFSSGTSTTSTSTVRLNGGGAQTVSGAAGPRFNNLEILNGSAVTMGATLITSLSLTLTSGSLTTGGNTLDVGQHFTLESGTSFNAGASSILLDENWTNNGATLNMGTSTLTFDNDAANGVIGGASSTTFYNLVMNDTSNSTTLGINTTVSNNMTVTSGTFNTSGSAYTLQVDGNLLINGGTLTANASDIRLGGNFTRSSGTFTAGTSTLLFYNDATNSTLDGVATTFYRITVDDTGNSVTLAVVPTVSNLLTVTAGTFNTGADIGLTVTGSVLINGGTLTLNNSAVVVQGDWTHSSGTVNPGGSTVSFTGTAAAVSISGAGATSFNNLTVAKSNNSRVLTLVDPVTVGGTLLLTTGLLDVQSATLSASALDLDQTNTHTRFSGGATQTVPGTAYYNLTIDKNAGTATLGGDASTLGTFTLTAGGFDTGANRSLDIAGSMTQDGGAMSLHASAVAVGGNWTTNAGVIDYGTGTVTFNGSATPVSVGSVVMPAFYNLTVDKSSSSAIAALAGSMAVTHLVTLTSGEIDFGGYTLDAGGVSVGASGTLRLTDPAAVLSLAPGGAVSVAGGFVANPPALAPTIRAASGNFSLTCAAGSTISLNGLNLRNLNAAGLVIQTGATISNFKRVDFRDNEGGGGSRHLDISSDTLELDSTGLYFDDSALANVRLAGNGDADGETVMNIEFLNTVVNGARAGEAFDIDDDANVDGMGDTPLTDGAVVAWTYLSQSLAPNLQPGGGVVQGFPLAAVDFKTFAYYATYVVVRDVDASNVDTVFVLDTTGAVQYAFDVDHATYGDIVHSLIYDTFDETQLMRDVNGNGDELDTNVHGLYFGTSGGFIFFLIDTGAALEFPAAGPWATPFSDSAVTAVTSPLISDRVSVYFGGTQGSAPPNRIFSVNCPDKSLGFNLNGISPITAAPAYYVVGSSYLYLASDASMGTASIFRVNTATQDVDISDVTPTADIKGAISIGNTNLYAADESGVLHALKYKTDFSAVSGWPYDTGFGSPLRSGVSVQSTTNIVWFTDLSGRAFKVNAAGVLQAGWPKTPGTAQVSSKGLFLSGFSRYYIGNENGKVFALNSTTGATMKTYTFGAGVKTSLSYEFNRQKLMVSTNSGKVYYVDP